MGSETLSIQLRAAFEAITGLEGYQNQNYEEYGIEAETNVSTHDRAVPLALVQKA